MADAAILHRSRRFPDSTQLKQCGNLSHSQCAQGTMTGTIHAPTMDTYLARELGLRSDIRRLNVESMGCLTGFRCLALASELAAGRPGNTVLTVVCDIRSALGNQLTAHAAGAPVDRANVIASCLFRDSGGAAIVAVPQQQQQRRPRGGATPGSRVLSRRPRPSRGLGMRCRRSMTSSTRALCWSRDPSSWCSMESARARASTSSLPRSCLTGTSQASRSFSAWQRMLCLHICDWV